MRLNHTLELERSVHGGLRPRRGLGCSQGGNELIWESAHTRQVALTFRFQACKKSGQTTKAMHDGGSPHAVNVLKIWPSEMMTLILYSLGLWSIISMLLMEGRWTDETELAGGTFGCCWQSWGTHSQEVSSLLLDRAYERELVSLIFLDYSGIKHWEFLWDLEQHSLLKPCD